MCTFGFFHCVGCAATAQLNLKYYIVSECCYYLLSPQLSISIVLGFGIAVPDSCNTLWEQYTGRPESEGPPTHWATVLRFIVVLFPALDVISVYPVNVSVTITQPPHSMGCCCISIL